MNTELLGKLGSLAVSCIIIMALIVVACLITPKLAKWIQKKNPQLADKIERGGPGSDKPARVDDAATGRSPQEDYEAHSAFESSKEEDFDPNYKIYNEDIYAFNFGKKKKKTEDDQERKDEAE
ncbi:hypothetical protein [uncultured Ruminococcus sp.]|uniref:hypothetical protein n=1 Tax=uncultured Ruminococcus sp. TaxID=165186 RepID=UPI0025D9EB8C|nr:hypothetical protein [uncultured Ruminococcus sp.]